MQKNIEETNLKRKEFDRIAEKFFPNLSSPLLVQAAIALERTLK